MKKRTLFLMIIFAVLFAVLCLCSCEADCVKTRFSTSCDGHCYDATCAMCGSEMCGVDCESKNLDCSWYPLLCGCYNGCPVVCGLACATGGTWPDEGVYADVGATYADVSRHPAVEGVDFTVDNIEWSAKSISRPTFEELFAVLKQDYDDFSYNITLTITITANTDIKDFECVFQQKGAYFVGDVPSYGMDRKGMMLDRGETYNIQFDFDALVTHDYEMFIKYTGDAKGGYQ